MFRILKSGLTWTHRGRFDKRQAHEVESGAAGPGLREDGPGDAGRAGGASKDGRCRLQRAEEGFSYLLPPLQNLSKSLPPFGKNCQSLVEI